MSAHRLLSRIVVCLLVISSAATAKSPNFVVVLADDLGYGDLGCYGHPLIKTPHLDRFAKQSLVFTDCYAAAANCSPSRAGLMTGRTPFRLGIQNWIPMFSPMHVRAEEVTVAEVLKRKGYSTCHVGKWHLNGLFNLPDQPQPHQQGFDHWFSTQNNALPTHRNPDNFVRNSRLVGRLQGYSADLVTDEAIRWLRELRDKTKPFFLFVCYHEPHEPIATHERLRKLYPGTSPSQQRHHGNVSQMDAGFGRLMRVLDDLSLHDETVVLFTSDNGPAITRAHPHGSAGPLRGKKGQMFEGGIRVPGMIRWPGRTRPGTRSSEPVCGVDLLPTICDALGLPLPANRAIDGTSFLPALEGGVVHRKTPLYWHFHFARGKPKVAMRIGDWKLLAGLTGGELKITGDITKENNDRLKSAELHEFELYNLKMDQAEKNDLAEKRPNKLKEMVTQLRTLHRAVRDESPRWPLWNWPRYEGRRIRAHRKMNKQ